MSFKVFIDLEMLPIFPKLGIYKEGCKKIRNEIVQIGAVMLDENNNEISSFKRTVLPDYTKEITRKYRRLLKITYADLERGCKLTDAINDFVLWTLSYSDDVCIYAWGDSDFTQIIDEIKYKDIEVSEELLIIFSNWFDLQADFDQIVGSKEQIGLKSAIEMCSLEFEGRWHDSLYDSRNTARLYREMQNPYELRKNIEAVKKYTSGDNHMVCTLGDMIDFSAILAQISNT